MLSLPCSEVKANLAKYIKGRTATARDASFDFCFNYFQAARKEGSLIATPAKVALSCLQLGFFLASWGMYRGKAILLQRSSKVYEPLIIEIAATAPEVWEIDADCYTEENVERLLELAAVIRRKLPGRAGESHTLVTKIMLGVFGNVPAFDTNFRSGSGLSSLTAKALRTIRSFYTQNASLIEEYRVHTLDFATGQETSRQYTRAKVIDMVFFIEGSKPAPRQASLTHTAPTAEE